MSSIEGGNFDILYNYHLEKLQILKDISNFVNRQTDHTIEWQWMLDNIFKNYDILDYYLDENHIPKEINDDDDFKLNITTMVSGISEINQLISDELIDLLADCFKYLIYDPYNLLRFLIAQTRGTVISGNKFVNSATTYSDAINGMRTQKKKIGDWIWYCFPQFILETTKGNSKTSKYFQIFSVDEAVEYLRHPILGERYNELANLVLEVLNDFKGKIKQITEATGKSEEVALTALINTNNNVDEASGYLLDNSNVKGTSLLHHVMGYTEALGDDVQKLHESVSLFYLVAKQLGNRETLETLKQILEYYEGGYFNGDSTDNNVHKEVKKKYNELLLKSELISGSQPELESTGTGSDAGSDTRYKFRTTIRC